MTASIKSRVLVATVGALLIAVMGRASAQETVPPPPTSPPPVGGSVGYFGERGQIVLNTHLHLNIIRRTVSMDGGSDTTVLIRPSLDYFISPNFSVGGVLGLSIEPQILGGDRTDITVGARAGYNVNLTSVLTIWIRGGFEYVHQSQAASGMFPSQSGYLIPLSIFAPVLWHPVTHFFIGAGPSLRTDLISSTEGMDGPKTTDFGVTSIVGGYFGGL